MLPQRQMLRKVAGGPTALESILAPPEYETCLGDLYSVAWMEDRNVLLVLKYPSHLCILLTVMSDINLEIYLF